MVSTFDETRDQLRTLDAVLDEDTFEQAIVADKRSGFDPDKQYDTTEVERLRKSPWTFKSIPYLAVTGLESKYVVLEVAVERDEERYTQTYLRGFERFLDSHPINAQIFMGTVGSRVGWGFTLSDQWPRIGDPRDDQWEKSVSAQNERGVKLTITAIGGEKYTLKDGQICLFGRSQAFGPIPKDYQDRVDKLFESLVQKSCYQGFKVNKR